MRVLSSLLPWMRFAFVMSLTLCGGSVLACEVKAQECIYSRGQFTPFEVKFSTETSAGGLNVDVGISQRLQSGWLDQNWSFRTKITAFVYGLYGSVTDSSEFIIRRDKSYQTLNFSRKAKAYGVIPIAPTSFKQKFAWEDSKTGSVRSKFKGEWYRFDVDHTILDQALLPLQLRVDLLREGSDLGTRIYKATSKKHVDDDFMVRYVKEADLQTPMGRVPTVIYELMKGHHKATMYSVMPGHDLDQIGGLLDQLIVLRKERSSKRRNRDMEALGEQLNALLKVDRSTIVSISEEEAKSASKDAGADGGKSSDKSVINKASEIEEGNARVFFWLSRKHGYLPVKMLAVIDSNAWSKVMIKSLEIDGNKVRYL